MSGLPLLCVRPQRHHVQLYPPGRLLHLVRVGRMHGGADGGTIYWPRWTTAYQLMSRIVVARNMCALLPCLLSPAPAAHRAHPRLTPAPLHFGF